MFYRSARNEKSDADKYLENCAKDFVFDLKRGIYTPKAYYKKRKGKRFQGFFKIATIGLSALTLYYVIRYTNYARRQWHEMQITTIATDRAADAAKSAAETAAANLQSSQQQFRIEQRPYIFASPVPGFSAVDVQNQVSQPRTIHPFGDGTAEISMAVTITNGGRSPAINTFSTNGQMYFSSRKEMSKRFANFVPEYGKIGGILAIGVGETVRTTLVKLSPEEFKQVTKGDSVVYVIGAVQYTDIFEPRLSIPYETKYCFDYIPTGLPFGDCGAAIK